MLANISPPLLDAKIFHFENGFKLLVLEDDSAELASAQLWIRTGSALENDLLGSGASHFLEHLVFKGTEKYSASEISSVVQRMGGRMNAYTSYDRTVFHIDYPCFGVKGSKNSHLAFEVLAEIALRALIPEDEFERERDVIRREIDMCRDDPDDVLHDLSFATTFAEHPMSQPIIGHLDLLNTLAREDIFSYYKKNYTPERMFMIVVGAVEAKEVFNCVATYFADEKRRRASALEHIKAPSQVCSRRRALEFPAQNAKMQSLWLTPNHAHPDALRLEVLASILAGGKSSRLYCEIREKQLVHNVYAYKFSNSLAGAFIIGLELEEGKIEQAQKVLSQEIRNLQKNGANPDELHKVAQNVMTNYIRQQSSMAGKAGVLANSWFLSQSVDYPQIYLRNLQKLQPDEIHQVANKYLDADKENFIKLIPRKKNAQRQAKHSTVKSKKKPEILKLDNGAKFILKVDKRLPLVNFATVSLGSLLVENASNNGSTALMSSCLLKGSHNRTAEQIANELESLGASMNSFVGANTFGISGSFLKLGANLEKVLELLADCLKNPVFPEDKVEIEKEAQIAGLIEARENPLYTAFKQARALLFGEKNYGLERQGEIDIVQSFDTATMQKIHKNLSSPKNLSIAIYGNFDEEKTAELCQSLFGDFTNAFQGSDARSSKDLLAELRAQNSSAQKKSAQTLETLHLKNQATLVLAFPGIDFYDDKFHAYSVFEEFCSGMDSPIFERIREKQGLSYFVSSQHAPGVIPGALYFYLGTSAANIDRAQEELIAELQKIRAKGLSFDELEKSKNAALGEQALSRQSLKSQASEDSVNFHYGLGVSHSEDYLKKIKNLKLAELNELLPEILDFDQLIISRCLPKQ